MKTRDELFKDEVAEELKTDGALDQLLDLYSHDLISDSAFLERLAALRSQARSRANRTLYERQEKDYGDDERECCA
jgi:hypothetical protein